jgi:ferredoxin
MPDDDGPTTYSAAVFYRRLDPLAMYENWGDVPAEAREAVIDWQLQEFINIWQPAIEEMRENPDARVRIPNRDYMLLDEALAMVDAATDFVIIPCDCKEIVRACDRPREVCVRLNEGATATLEQGHGRQVTKEEMKQIVVDAHRGGLMATGNRNWKEDGAVFGFCNCCACDCYPIRAGEMVGLGDAYPRVYYVAERDMDKCHHCGMCAKRCHFDAFYRDGTRTEVVGKTGRVLKRKTVLFNPELCRGCGLCATTCTEQAITMKPLRVTQEA